MDCRAALCVIALLTAVADTAVAHSPTYSFNADAQRLVLSAPGAIHCATSTSGFVSITIDGVARSSDPASPDYASALAGVTGDALREISISGATAFSIGPFVGQRHCERRRRGSVRCAVGVRHRHARRNPGIDVRVHAASG